MCSTYLVTILGLLKEYLLLWDLLKQKKQHVGVPLLKPILHVSHNPTKRAFQNTPYIGQAPCPSG